MISIYCYIVIMLLLLKCLFSGGQMSLYLRAIGYLITNDAFVIHASMVRAVMTLDADNMAFALCSKLLEFTWIADREESVLVLAAPLK